MQACDREGAFRAVISDYGLKEMESGAVAVAIKARLTDFWDAANGEWIPWEQYEMEVEGDIWIVKKDGGGVNQNGAESLMRHAGWDGSLESISNATWQPTACQVVVKRDEYKGNVRYKIAFVNALDRTPGGLSNVDPAKVRELETRYGAQFRAIGGNIKRNAPPAVGRPASPPASAAPPRPPEPAAASSNDKIPF